MFRRDLFAKNTDTPLPAPPLLKTPNELLERGILNKYSDKIFFLKAIKNTHFQTPLQVSGVLQAIRVKLRLFSIIFEAAGMMHSRD